MATQPVKKANVQKKPINVTLTSAKTGDSLIKPTLNVKKDGTQHLKKAAKVVGKGPSQSNKVIIAKSTATMQNIKPRRLKLVTDVAQRKPIRQLRIPGRKAKPVVSAELQQQFMRQRRQPLDVLHNTASWTRNLVLICSVIMVGVLFKDVVFGELLILAYTVIALLRRIDSATSFKMSLVMLFATPVVQAVHNYSLAQTFAIYAFLLMFVSVICALAEQYRMNSRAARILKNVVKKA